MATEAKGNFVILAYSKNGVPYLVEIDAAGKLAMRASELETLLAGGLPTALDSAALKVREQSAKLHGRSFNYDETKSAYFDLVVVAYGLTSHAKVISVGMVGDLAARADVGFQVFCYSAAGDIELYQYPYSGRVDWLREPLNPFQELGVAYIPNIYHVNRYVDASHWHLRIIFSPPLDAYYGFGVRLINGGGVSTRFYGGVLYVET